MLSTKECPFTGPYSNASTKMKSKGPTVEALKRAISRLGFMTWKGQDFTQAWPRAGAFDTGFRKWQQENDIPADGVYGRQTWKELRSAKVTQGQHKGEYALDRYAQLLIRDEWQELNVPDEQDVRAAIVEFCLKAEGNEDAWHYRQARPVDVSVSPTAGYVWSDCSGYVIQAFYYAKQKTGVNVPDPAKGGGAGEWSGYGNTSTEDDWPRVGEPFRVGDLAHYSGHVTLCRRGGTARTAIFSSHGQEAGPMPVSLHYRSDLRYICRPPLMA